jgi:uncharacterized protein YjbI with pentapeptide repeats
VSRLGLTRGLGFAALLLLVTHSAQALPPQSPEWTWMDSLSKTHTRSELDAILRKHDLWVKSNHKSGQQANLSEADLSGADLQRANLSNAILYKVNLIQADLDHADLSNAFLSWGNLIGAAILHTNLSNAQMEKADLRGATIILASLRSAILINADLSGASVPANLSEAHLDGANLSGTDLTGADLTDTKLFHLDLSGTTYEPISNPNVHGIAAAEHLELLLYRVNPDSLVQLRKLFADGGFQDQERKITYAIKRRESEIAWDGCKSLTSGDKTRAILWSADSNLANCTSYVVNRVFFDLTCQYGMSPAAANAGSCVLAVVLVVLLDVHPYARGIRPLSRVCAGCQSKLSVCTLRTRKNSATLASVARRTNYACKCTKKLANKT